MLTNLSVFFIVTVVKLWHTVDGIFMCVYTVMHVSGQWAPRSLLLALDFQMGFYHYSRLRMECHPRTSSIPVDDMGL